MKSVYFVVVDPLSRRILRTGQCWPEDAALQGEAVLVFETDPELTSEQLIPEGIL